MAAQPTPPQTPIEIMRYLSDQAPHLDQAVQSLIETMRRQPRSLRERREVNRRLEGIAAAWADVLAHLKAAKPVADNAALAQAAVNIENLRLRKTEGELRARIAELEADLEEWRREYEPDAVPDRPAFFSNIRRAVSAFRS